MAAYLPPKQGNDLVFNPENFDYATEGLSLQDADARYLKLSGGALQGSLNLFSLSASTRVEVESTDSTPITSTTNCDSYGLHLHSVLSSSNGRYPGSAIAFNNSSADNVPLSSISLDKISNGVGQLVIAVRNGSDCNERFRVTDSGINIQGTISVNGTPIVTDGDSRYVQLTGSSMTGQLSITTAVRNQLTLTQTNANLSSNILFQTATGVPNVEFGVRGSTDTNPGDVYLWRSGFRLTFANSTNLCRIYGALTTDGHVRAPLIGLGNNLPTTLTRDITILESSADPDIVIGRADSNSNAFRISYTHVGDGNALNRLVIAPIGGTTAQTLTFNANGRIGIGSPTPTTNFEVLGNINVSGEYRIGGTNIDNRYLRIDQDSTTTNVVRFYATQAAGAADRTIVRFGHQTISGDWFLRHHASSGGAENNCLELLNTNSNLLGISFGTFNGTSVGDGCMAVFNGIQGDGNFIKASSINCNGSLHLNAGIPQSVSAGWTFDSTGQRSNSGGTVSVSLYCYNNIWVRGALYATSDRRLKNIHADIDTDKAMRLLDITPKWYTWKSDENAVPQLGLVAQDLLKEGLSELTHTFKNADVKEADSEFDIPEGKQLVVAYDRIPLYLLEIIKRQQKQIKKQEALIQALIDTLPTSRKKQFDTLMLSHQIESLSDLELDGNISP